MVGWQWKSRNPCYDGYFEQEQCLYNLLYVTSVWLFVSVHKYD